MARRYWISWALFFTSLGAIALVLAKTSPPVDSVAPVLILAVTTVAITIWASRHKAPMAEQIIPSKGIAL